MRKIPVAFFSFRRPDCTQKVLEEIRQYRPERLFLIADGPSATVPLDVERCRATRQILQSVDWPCDVKTEFSEINLGCKRRLFSGINWVFSQVEEAIILEDDCVPCSNFFRFCTEMLDRYRDNPRVMHITGTNVQEGHLRGDGSYYFSYICHVWGWASWRRAWQGFDVEMLSWPQAKREGWGAKFFPGKLENEFWTEWLDWADCGKLDSWAIPWSYHVWRQNGLSIIPNVNLVTNIGGGLDATHTKGDVTKLSVPIGSLEEIRHPSAIFIDIVADRFTFDHHYGGIERRLEKRPFRRLRYLLSRIKRLALRLLPTHRRSL